MFIKNLIRYLPIFASSVPVNIFENRILYPYRINFNSYIGKGGESNLAYTLFIS